MLDSLGHSKQIKILIVIWLLKVYINVDFSLLTDEKWVLHQETNAGNGFIIDFLDNFIWATDCRIKGLKVPN